MLINIEILDTMNIRYDWKTLYVGLSLDIMEIEEVSKYATSLMSKESYVDNEFINELVWGVDGKLKGELLSKMSYELDLKDLIEDSELWNFEVQKLRYCTLKFLRNTIKNNKELLKKVSEIYADFGYPSEMEGFIPYMPPKDGYDPTKYSVEENYAHMVKIFDVFLEREKELIGNEVRN